jgi:flagellar motor protein MotB
MLILVAIPLFVGCAELQELRADNALLREQNAQLSRQVAILEQQSQQYLSQRQLVEESYADEMRERTVNAQQVIDELERSERQLMRQVEEAETRIKTLTKELENVEKRLKQQSEKTAATVTERDQIRLQVQQLIQQEAAQEKEVSELRTKLTDVQRKLEQAEAEHRRELEKQAEKVADKNEPPAWLANTAVVMRPIAKVRGGIVEQREDRLVIRIPANELFARGVIELSDPGKATLNQLAAKVSSNEIAHLLVAGHTDNQPIQSLPFYNNTELSFRRAFAVGIFLAENTGVPQSKIIIEANGEHRPIASNRSPEGRAQNRRVELHLVAKQN